ncbi:putative RNAse P, Rpr2/Rpp21 subunit protein [Helianthus annuus]|nr:putative RNAse P, Rpr2/Rpp21 subunit protein [Helianthus annuus]
MGKKGLSKKGPAATSGPQMSVTIREASTGKKHTNAKSSLKLQHIKNLAVWASRDGAIPSLGAFFGHHLAASSEAFGAPVDPSLFTCQRCESVLHPGHNCTIRIEKNKKNARRKGLKVEAKVEQSSNCSRGRAEQWGSSRMWTTVDLFVHGCGFDKSARRFTPSVCGSPAIT